MGEFSTRHSKSRKWKNNSSRRKRNSNNNSKSRRNRISSNMYSKNNPKITTITAGNIEMNIGDTQK